MDSITIHETVDACVTDACAFLGVDRPQFFALAHQWGAYSQAFKSFDDPREFYLAWDGDRGRSNLCANILDQFTRPHILNLIPRLPVETGSAPLSFADIGCGTAAASFSAARRYRRAYLVDVPNLAQKFVSWRCEHHHLSNISIGTLDVIREPVQVMMCIDVLEHIAEATAFFAELNTRIYPSGILILQAPWHSMTPHPEHLPEAERNWNTGGGRAMLETQFNVIERWQAGGIYQKKAA